MKKTEHYKGHRWTNDELRALMALWAAEKTLDEISAELNVTTFAVLKMVQKLRKNGVPLARRRRGNSSDRANKSWTQGEAAFCGQIQRVGIGYVTAKVFKTPHESVA